MYNYTVPVMCRTFANDDRESAVKIFKEMGVKRVLNAISTYKFDEAQRSEDLRLLRDNCRFLKSHGFEVGAWLWTFWDKRENSDFTRMKLQNGTDSKQAVCPSDDSFRAFAAKYITDIAECGVDLILYDDDFRYGNLAGEMGCCCKNHLAYMGRLLNEDLTVEKLDGKLLSGGENRYRSAFLKAKRHYFELFAKDMRRALDRVRPEVRLGVCSCFPNWDHDGITTYEISKLLAGNTKPFLRLTGAPFWALPNAQLANHRLQDTIETTRMARSFCESNTDVEIVGEGDGFPRPRWMCPASHIEGYDQALRADGRFDGIMKYTVDYTSSHVYEGGYNRLHKKNLPIYAKIDAMFEGKKLTGVRVFEHLNKYEKMDIPEAVTNNRMLEHTFFSYAARMLTAASIPTVYDGEEHPAIVFGENAKYLPQNAVKRGLILDARAAEILTARGVDVGLKSKGEEIPVETERFVETGELVSLTWSAPQRAYRITPESTAKAESYFLSSATEEPAVASYFYENKNGERFLVFAYDGTLSHNALFRNYERADQLKRALPRLGKQLGFTVCTSPDLYTIAKEGDGKIAVGLWNFSADAVEEPFIELTGEKDSRVVSVIGCEATVEGNRISLSRIEPYGFAAVEFTL